MRNILCPHCGKAFGMPHETIHHGNDLLVSNKEIAEYLGVSERTIRRMIREEKLPQPFKIIIMNGKKKRIYLKNQLVALRRSKKDKDCECMSYKEDTGTNNAFPGNKD